MKHGHAGQALKNAVAVQIFFGQHIRRAMPDGAGEEELLSGRVQIVCVNAAKMKITSIPVELRTQLEALQ